MNKKQLLQQINRKKSYLCIGLDSDISKIPPHLLKYKNPNWDTIPLFIEANSIDFENHKLFFDTICKRVIQINNDIRPCFL